MYLAKKENKDFDVWGDGNSLREFLYIDDLADILLKLIELKQIPDRLIVSGRKQQSIREIVEILANISKFKGTIVWDETKPNGQRSRPTSKALFDRLFPNFKYTSVYDGLEETWRWFIENYSHVRTQY
jgi:GDP-L-fucose synthase